jgi:hypothetical protein
VAAGGDIILGSWWVDSTSRIYKSTDGENFTNTLSIANTGKLATAAFSGTAWVVVGAAGIYRSDDFGDTWALVHSGVTFIQVAYGAGVYVAGTFGTDVYRSTDDGLTWTLVDISSTGVTNAKLVHYTGSAFIVAGAPMTTGARSVDGASDTWSAVTLVGTASAAQLVDIQSGAEGTLICGNSFSPNTLWLSKSTDDGLTWSDPGTSGLPSDADINAGLTYGGGVFVCAGRKGFATSVTDYIAISTNGGGSWSQPDIPASNTQISSVAYSNTDQSFKFLGRLTPGSDNDILAHSPTGATWSVWYGPAATAGAQELYLFSGLPVASVFWTNFRRCYETE